MVSKFTIHHDFWNILLLGDEYTNWHSLRKLWNLKGGQAIRHEKNKVAYRDGKWK